MSTRGARRWLLLALVLTLPLPVLGPFGGLVPPVRHWILLAVTTAVAASEGAAGPVPGLLILFAVHALGTLALAFALAWAVARALASLPERARGTVVLLACAAMLALALATEPYQPPFGRSPTTNLLGVLS